MQGKERIGRRLSEKKPRYIKRIRRGLAEGASAENLFHYKLFKPKAGETSISTDLLHLVPVEKIADIAKRDAGRDDRVFYGWAVILHEFVLRNGFTVRPSRGDSNPYHADLFFPNDVNGRGNEDARIKKYAHRLSAGARWIDCPQ